MLSRSRTLIAMLATCAGATAVAAPEERTISFYHIHSKETLTITYKRDGKFIPEAMKKIDWIMRDWRRNESIQMDPTTVDIIWEMHQELGSREPVHIICGYRSRGTNEMLRKTVGGQASNSQHITGKAIDVAFPDIDARQLRYSALIKERGGVGYYPTSAIPFVHVDTSRVRHWPGIGRDELALLFPSGRSKHIPSDGKPITAADVKAARSRNPDLVQRVAAFFDIKTKKTAPVLIADAGKAAPFATAALTPPAPKPATRPAQFGEQRMALAAPMPPAEVPRPETLPKLVAAPQLIERPAQFTPRPSDQDRQGLGQLVTAAMQDAPLPPSAPARASTPAAQPKPAVKAPAPVLASLGPDLGPFSGTKPDAPSGPAPTSPTAWEATTTSGWEQAPEFDEDHPEELFYRPFPLAPLLTASASADDPALAHLVHPDVAKTLDMIDDVGAVLPMRFRPGQQVAEMLWSKEFRGQAVSLAELTGAGPEPSPAPKGLSGHLVKTSAR